MVLAQPAPDELAPASPAPVEASPAAPPPEAAVPTAVPAQVSPPVDPVIREAQNGIAVWHPVAIRDGRLLVIELEPVPGCPDPKIQWGARTFSTFAAGVRRHSLLPVSLGATPGDKTFAVVCGRRKTTFSVKVFTGDYPESKLSVDPRFTSRPPKRTVEESANIRKALASGPAGREWTATFVRPTAGIFTSTFGVNRTFNGKVSSRHRGLDFDGKVGDPIVAVNDGVVVLAAKDYYFTGSAVFLAHGDELYTMYFHMSRLDVATGDKVKRGQVIGLVGASGRVTGPHLHFGFKLAGTYLDPEDLMDYGQVPLLPTDR